MLGGYLQISISSSSLRKIDMLFELMGLQKQKGVDILTYAHVISCTCLNWKKGVDILTYAHVISCTCLNWHWLTMLGIKINLSGALRAKLFFFMWRHCLECDAVNRNVWKEYLDISLLWFSIKANVVKQESVKEAS